MTSHAPQPTGEVPRILLTSPNESDLELNHGHFRSHTESDAATLCEDSDGSPKDSSESELSTQASVTRTKTVYLDPDEGEYPRSGRGNALLRVKTETWKKWSSNPRKGMETTTKYIYQEVDSSWTAGVIVVCFFVAGMTDVVAFMSWGIFVNMQTGNTVLIAMRIVNPASDKNPLVYVKNLAPIFAFWFGCIIFSILHRGPRGLDRLEWPMRRWTLFLGFAVQTVLWLVSAVLATTGVIKKTPLSFNDPGKYVTWLDLVPICLLAFEAAGQVCVSRILAMNDLATIAISAVYHDIIAEFMTIPRVWRESATWKIFAQKQKKQARRISCCTAVFLGGLLGGYLYGTGAGVEGFTWVGMGLKALVGIAWCFWKKRIVTETVVTTQPRQDKASTSHTREVVEHRSLFPHLHVPHRVRTHEPRLERINTLA